MSFKCVHSYLTLFVYRVENCHNYNHLSRELWGHSIVLIIHRIPMNCFPCFGCVSSGLIFNLSRCSQVASMCKERQIFVVASPCSDLSWILDSYLPKNVEEEWTLEIRGHGVSNRCSIIQEYQTAKEGPQIAIRDSPCAPHMHRICI